MTLEDNAEVQVLWLVMKKLPIRIQPFSGSIKKPICVYGDKTGIAAILTDRYKFIWKKL